MSEIIHGPSLLTDFDVHLFREGKHFRLYEKLGANVVARSDDSLKLQAQAQAENHPHPLPPPQGGGNKREGVLDGILFSVWAPNAKAVSVVGDFNGWDPGAHRLAVRWDSSGIWEGFLPAGLGHNPESQKDSGYVPRHSRYKFHVTTHTGLEFDKADPFARFSEAPPRTASVVWNSGYEWHDQEWLAQRAGMKLHSRPLSIYEIHPGSWRRPGNHPHPPLRNCGNSTPQGRGTEWPSWRELADELIPHVLDMGFTHVELTPVMEHPFYGSWGYQATGYFAPTARYGTPDDLKYLVDRLHQAGIGVILDWTPAHFPDDPHGLVHFDGTCLYEHADPRQGRHPDWGSLIFNYGRNEVRSFLTSSALYWLDEFHADGLRLDAVASMLYLDYSRKPGEWVPNKDGGRENLDAIEFLKDLNRAAYREHPGIQTFAEESTAWPQVSRPTDSGGLGFGFKWNMGWMHDTLRYFSHDPVHRSHHQDDLTFSLLYAFSENFVLPLSHDEVVHGKRSLLEKMPGDDWQKLANLRLLLGWLFTHPGKKLLFMGAELGQRGEWNHDRALDWHLLEHEPHQGIRRWVQDLNRLYRAEPALFELDGEPAGFSWVDCTDKANSVLAFLRHSAGGINTKGTKDTKPEDPRAENPESKIQNPKSDPSPSSLLVVLNFTPVPRHGYRVGVPEPGEWQELLNSDAKEYGGSGQGNFGLVPTDPAPLHGCGQSLALTLPPLAIVVLKPGAKESRNQVTENRT